MPSRGQSITVVYQAWNVAAQDFQINDAANHTLRLVKDGVEAVPDNNPSEIDSTNLPGRYALTLTTAEATAWVVHLGGKSTTTDVIILDTVVTFEDEDWNDGDRLDLILDAILAKTNLIGTVESGLSWPDDAEDIVEVTIYPGDAYYVAEGRAFSVSIDTTPPVLTGGTVKWICTAGENGQIQTEGNGTITGAGTVGSPYIVTAGDLTEASTEELQSPGIYDGRLVVTLANGHNHTVKRYKVTVPLEVQPEVAP